MKKLCKRSLAILLAVLMIAGLGAVASAKSPLQEPVALYQDTVEDFELQGMEEEDYEYELKITKLPADMSLTMEEGEMNFSGMEFEVSGGIFTPAQTIAYDDVADARMRMDEILWYFYVEPIDYENWWVLGENAAQLVIYGEQCTEFYVERVIDGVEYGYFDTKTVFFGSADITVTCKEYQLDFSSATPLTLNEATAVNLSQEEEAFFVFTAPEDGYYSFKSTGAQPGEILYSRDGEELHIPNIDPQATLFDATGDLLAENDDRGSTLDFGIFRFLEKGETVYLCTSLYGQDGDAEFSIVVSTYDPLLVLESNAVNIKFHELIDIDALLEGTGLTADDVSFEYDYEYLNYDCRGLYGAKRGETTFLIMADDGRSAEVSVTIDYSLAQWFCVFFLGGELWLKYTQLGPLDLVRDIGILLRDTGLRQGLYILLSDWNVPEWMLRWLW